MTRIYFAHSKKTYDTDREKKVIDWIRKSFKGYEIVNPKAYKIDDGVGQQYYVAMQAFFKVIDTCDLMVVMGNTDGVVKERNYALEHKISVIEVPQGISGMRTYT